MKKNKSIVVLILLGICVCITSIMLREKVEKKDISDQTEADKFFNLSQSAQVSSILHDEDLKPISEKGF